MVGIDRENRTFKIDPDELMDIRKHALECACRVRSGSTYASDQIIALAKIFEDHLTRRI